MAWQLQRTAMVDVAVHHDWMDNQHEWMISMDG
jgi:hypothetical protein